jgi:hypothetical protein
MTQVLGHVFTDARHEVRILPAAGVALRDSCQIRSSSSCHEAVQAFGPELIIREVGPSFR